MPGQKGRGRGKKKKRNPLYAPLSFIIICAALIFGMSVFFRVSVIEVVGAERYTDEEIIEASGLEPGDNLFFTNTFSATGKVFNKLPYIEEVKIRRALPNRVVIEVTETKAAAYVNVSGELWLIDSGCKYLQRGDASLTSELIRVDGMEISDTPAGGARMSAEEVDGVRVEFLAEILKAMSRREIWGETTYIDMENVSNPSFDYTDRFTVRLGKNEDVDYKLELLVKAVEQLAPGDSGTIDLSVDKKAHFRPD